MNVQNLTRYIIAKKGPIVKQKKSCYIIQMLYTGKGDNGTTSAFGCDQRFSKSSAITEALGTLDEVNSFLGVVKTNMKASEIARTLSDVQQNLFTIQAEVAGAEKHIGEAKVRELENIINAIEAEIPPIKTFFVSGGTEVASLLDFARTLARRAERRVVGVSEEGLVAVGKDTLAYLNRLSSLLYALARQTNHKSGIKEESPKY
jgi:cob(I)alamin adenosyltransferase